MNAAQELDLHKSLKRFLELWLPVGHAIDAIILLIALAGNTIMLFFNVMAKVTKESRDLYSKYANKYYFLQIL